MSGKIYLRKEKTYKKIAITDESKPKISNHLTKKWQKTINIAASIISVTSALIMKITPDTMEVLITNENEKNPYSPGDSEVLGCGLYCETVIGKDQSLYIKNALENNVWKDNPDIDLNMISYYGLPLHWPDGKTFGTICILDSVEMNLTDDQIELFKKFKELIEDDLELLVTNQELSNFFQVNLDLLCIANTDGDFIRVNQAWADLLGYTINDLKKMKFLDFVHPDDLESTKIAIKKLESDEEITHFINRFRGESGKYYYIEWNSKASGKYIYAAARDITEKINQDKAINIEKKRLDWIIEGTDAGTWEWNIQTEKVVFNEKWAEMLGYTLEEISPTTINTWKELTHPVDLIKAEENLKKHFNGEISTYDMELRMKHKKGHWVWLNDRGRVISWTKDNKPLKMFGIHIDITERKEKAIKLEQTQRLLKDLTDQAPGVIYQFKLSPKGEYNFPYASQGIYEIYEVTPEEVIDNAEKAFNRIHSDDFTKVNNSIRASAKNLSFWHDVYRVQLPKQGLKWIEGNALPQKLEDGSVLWHGSIRDITSQKKQIDFQKKLAEVSSSLLKTNTMNIDQKINNALEIIGIFFNIDRSYIFEFSKENNAMKNTYEWCNKNIPSQKNQLQDIGVEIFPWAMNKFENNEVIYIPDVKKMDDKKSAEHNLLKILNLKSIVAIPIYVKKELFGFFGFDLVKENREFTSEDIRLLKIFTDVITSAFSKYIDDKRILELTYHDSLTSLYNRRFFENELLRLNTKRQLPLSIVIADINGLKMVNDSLGHEKGDELLIKSAEILKSVTRTEDILARQGGDEFAILLPNTTENVAEKIIRRIKRACKATKFDQINISIALGSATKTNIEENIYAILKKADDHMYQNKLSESKSAKSKIVQSLLNSLAVKSFETKAHAMRMTDLCIKFGQTLGLSNNEINRLALLSTLHDIGKITISEEILKKPGKLTKKEWEVIKEHPERGYRIANSSEEFAIVAEEIYTHHEKWSGKGYPRGLKNNEIPYLARVISIIDAYDVMTNERPYKQAMSKNDALKEIEDCAGSQFDPYLAKIFIDTMNNYNL